MNIFDLTYLDVSVISSSCIGVDSGDTIRVPKAGNSGRRGVQPGNLFIKLKVCLSLIFRSLMTGAELGDKLYSVHDQIIIQ